jgi:hypothetical protein
MAHSDCCAPLQTPLMRPEGPSAWLGCTAAGACQSWTWRVAACFWMVLEGGPVARGHRAPSQTPPGQLALVPKCRKHPAAARLKPALAPLMRLQPLQTQAVMRKRAALLQARRVGRPPAPRPAAQVAWCHLCLQVLALWAAPAASPPARMSRLSPHLPCKMPALPTRSQVLLAVWLRWRRARQCHRRVWGTQRVRGSARKKLSWQKRLLWTQRGSSTTCQTHSSGFTTCWMGTMGVRVGPVKRARTRRARRVTAKLLRHGAVEMAQRQYLTHTTTLQPQIAHRCVHCTKHLQALAACSTPVADPWPGRHLSSAPIEWPCSTL